MERKAKITIYGFNGRTGRFGSITREVMAPRFESSLEGLPGYQYPVTETAKLSKWLEGYKEELVLDYASGLNFQVDKFDIRYLPEQDKDHEIVRQLLTGELGNDEDAFNFAVCYCRMRNSLKGLPVDKTIEIVCSVLDIAYDANEAGYQRAQQIVNNANQLYGKES